MASSSRYIQMNDYVLVEYEYTDPSNLEEYEVDDCPVEILTNGYTSTNYMFTPDDAITDLGNIRDRSATPINNDKDEYVSLNTDLPIEYVDYDSQMTESANLEQVFDSPTTTSIAYDTVKFHMRAGFSFEDYDGYLFEIMVSQRDNTKMNLSSLVFYRTDSFQTLNPKPFLVGDKLYTTYIEIKIPAIKYFNFTTVNTIVGTDKIESRLTTPNIQPVSAANRVKGQGFLTSTLIDITLKGIYETNIINGFTYYKVKSLNSATLNQADTFGDLVAKIEEAEDGDYYRFYGEYNGIIFEDFITELNNQGNDYLVFHELTVNEQVGINTIESGNYTLLQTDNWDTINTFRPVLLNSGNAVSYTISYVLRLMNKVDNSQIIKSSQLSSYDVKKYGKKMMQLNMGLIPTITKVYNKIENVNILPETEIETVEVVEEEVITLPDPIIKTLTTTVEKIVIKTEYVNLFRDRINIKVGSSKVSVTSKKIN